jgi:hypothetical protein
VSPGQRSGPCGDTGRDETAAAKPLDLVFQSATADRKARERRVEQMQRALLDARQSDDDEAVRLLAACLDVEFVRRSYQRADDPIVRRYRRLLREAG